MLWFWSFPGETIQIRYIPIKEKASRGTHFYCRFIYKDDISRKVSLLFIFSMHQSRRCFTFLWEISCPYFMCLADQFNLRRISQTYSFVTCTPHCLSSLSFTDWAVDSGLSAIHILTNCRWMGLIFLDVTVRGLLMKTE